MKIALCLYGIPRDVKKGFTAYLQSLQTHNPGIEIEVFYHSWSVPVNEKANVSYWKWLNQKPVTSSDIYSPEKLSAFISSLALLKSGESQVQQNFDTSWVADYFQAAKAQGADLASAMENNASNFLSQFISRQRVCRLFKPQAKDYDWVLTGRFDITRISNTSDFSGENPLPDLKMLNPENIYVSGFRVKFQNDFIVPDNFILLSPQNYLKIFENLGNDIKCLYHNVQAGTEEHSTRVGMFDPESLLTEQFLRKGLYEKVRRRLGNTFNTVDPFNEAVDEVYFTQNHVQEKRFYENREFHPNFLQTFTPDDHITLVEDYDDSFVRSTEHLLQLSPIGEIYVANHHTRNFLNSLFLPPFARPRHLLVNPEENPHQTPSILPKPDSHLAMTSTEYELTQQHLKAWKAAAVSENAFSLVFIAPASVTFNQTDFKAPLSIPTTLLKITEAISSIPDIVFLAQRKNPNYPHLLEDIYGVEGKNSQNDALQYGYVISRTAATILSQNVGNLKTLPLISDLLYYLTLADDKLIPLEFRKHLFINLNTFCFADPKITFKLSLTEKKPYFQTPLTPTQICARVFNHIGNETAKAYGFGEVSVSSTPQNLHIEGEAIIRDLYTCVLKSKADIIIYCSAVNYMVNNNVYQLQALLDPELIYNYGWYEVVIGNPQIIAHQP